VTRIEQTLQTALAREEGKDLRTSSVHVSIGGARGSSDPTAELTQSGSHEIYFATDAAAGKETAAAAVPGPLPVALAPPRRGPGHATAGHVAFSTDTPTNPDVVYRGETIPSIERRSRRRTGLAILGGAGVVSFIAIVAIVQTNFSQTAPRSPASVVVSSPSSPAASTESLAPPKAPDPSPIAPPGPAPAVPVFTAKTKPAATPHRIANPVPPPAKKHFGVLDSPD
jgi:hypothetical protein